MRWIAIAMMTCGALLLFGAIGSRLSSDAIGMMIGMILGVLSGVPTAALVIIALRHAPTPPDHYYDPPEITITPTPVAEDVTPYMHLFRSATGMPKLSTRREQIAVLHTYLAHLEAEERKQ